MTPSFDLLPQHWQSEPASRRPAPRVVVEIPLVRSRYRSRLLRLFKLA